MAEVDKITPPSLTSLPALQPPAEAAPHGLPVLPAPRHIILQYYHLVQMQEEAAKMEQTTLCITSNMQRACRGGWAKQEVREVQPQPTAAEQEVMSKKGVMFLQLPCAL